MATSQKPKVVIVGAGYTGTEVTAHGQRLTTRLARTMPGLAGQEIRWMLLDLAPRVLAELDPRLSRTAERVLRRRGVEVLTGVSVAEALDGAVAVPGTEGIYACGDCAAVPDLTRPGQICGMTAQHAQRQGKLVATNVAASLGHGTARPYLHRDLGFLVDLGGTAAAANPLHIPLSGPAANAVTRGYHLTAMSGNRLRVLTDWALNAVTSPESASASVISARSVPLDVTKPRA